MYDWSVLRDNPVIQEQYSIRIQNRYAALSSETTGDDISMAYKNLVNANQQTAQELLPKKKHLKRSVNAKIQV